MAWIILIVSGAFEAVWATALGKSEGFSKLTPTLVFFGALVVSMGGLAYAMRDLPTGTSYAVWVGIGATLTVVYAMATGAEAVSLVKAICIMAIVGGVIGLKLAH
ncbi:multidrug efflux SMR transporter [Tsukamurella sp. PLM1]|uniref:DMT family transporter n=1 Tax=Tsukamurella sp. PLM1 TaxID=2929795 RepID=UPI00204D2238|nr:multidrug efflux SMR transporter [Tsukamurella sp. PLM1]BDH56105.1 QacE family quaternary ammonium compound efflux SMR transporter [Tsukamurella sp. PLM1]